MLLSVLCKQIKKHIDFFMIALSVVVNTTHSVVGSSLLSKATVTPPILGAV